jgi:FlaA1/EpsC-like NDP-sugar epimerase
MEFSSSTLLITGGTGSFGNAVLKRFLNTDIKEIRIFSLDEKSRMTCGICITMQK